MTFYTSCSFKYESNNVIFNRMTCIYMLFHTVARNTMDCYMLASIINAIISIFFVNLHFEYTTPFSLAYYKRIT